MAMDEIAPDDGGKEVEEYVRSILETIRADITDGITFSSLEFLSSFLHFCSCHLIDIVQRRNTYFVLQLFTDIQYLFLIVNAVVELFVNIGINQRVVWLTWKPSENFIGNRVL